MVRGIDEGFLRNLLPQPIFQDSCTVTYMAPTTQSGRPAEGELPRVADGRPVSAMLMSFPSSPFHSICTIDDPADHDRILSEVYVTAYNATTVSLRLTNIELSLGTANERSIKKHRIAKCSSEVFILPSDRKQVRNSYICFASG
jgi:hypothetical protein